MKTCQIDCQRANPAYGPFLEYSDSLLTRCTITGADDTADPRKLAEFAERFPFVEWAFLYGYDCKGFHRFPSPEQLRHFDSELPRRNKALHLCFNTVHSFVFGNKDLLDLASRFGRVQLNFGTCNVADKQYAKMFADQVRKNYDLSIILQYNAQTAHLLKPFEHDLPNNLSLLFDASVGRGICPEKWPEHMGRCLCGYAGGLGPDNIEKELPKIAVAAKGSSIWIDMETGVRTDERFDPYKAYQVLKAVKVHRKTLFAHPHNTGPL